MYFKMLFSVSLLFCATMLHAGSENRSVKPLSEIPTRVEEKLLFVQVRIQGKGPYWFAIDSGAHHTVIDPFVMGEAGVGRLAKDVVRGTGKGEVSAVHARPLELQLGALRVNVDEPLVIDLSGVPIPKWVHGLVGAELFEKYVVQIDPDNAVLRVFDPATYKVPSRAKQAVLKNENHRLFTEAVIQVSDRETVTHRLRIDTGSGDSISDEVVAHSSHVRETTLGNGLGASYKGVSGMYKSVSFGPYRFTDVWGPGAQNPGIGMEMLRRFIVTFDVSRGKLYLAPSSHFAEPFPAPGAD